MCTKEMKSEDFFKDINEQIRDGLFIGGPLRDVEPTHFTFQINSFSLLSKNSIEKYESRAFEVDGYKWKLSIYPSGNKNENGQDHISLYLGIEDTTYFPPCWEVNASFRFFVFDQILDKYLILGDIGGMTKRFREIKTEWGFPKLLPLATFENTSNGYLVNDSCFFGVEILVCKNKGCGEILSMEPKPVSLDYTWKVSKFSEIKDEQLLSGVFSAACQKWGDYKWQIRLYPKGEAKVKNKGYLSMFLTMVAPKEVASGTKLLVSFILRIKNQLHGDHQEFKDTEWWNPADSNCSWGWRYGIERDQLYNKKNGFVVKDKCIIEAQVTILGEAKKSLASKPNSYLFNA